MLSICNILNYIRWTAFLYTEEECCGFVAHIHNPAHSERSTFAFLNRLTRFRTVREALGFSLYKYLTELLFSEYVVKYCRSSDALVFAFKPFCTISIFMFRYLFAFSWLKPYIGLWSWVVLSLQLKLRLQKKNTLKQIPYFDSNLLLRLNQQKWQEQNFLIWKCRNKFWNL